MRKAGSALVVALLVLQTCPGRTQELEQIVERTFRKAVVKIDVSTNTTVIRDDKNICVSEGTGFLVTSRHIVTAQHVYELDPACGKPIIIVKSVAYGLQKLATVAGEKDDVALLEVEGGLPPDMCTLGLNTEDVYGAKAIRFGIPGGFDETPGAMPTKIGERALQFGSLVLMTPTATEEGESGGPVIYRFNVVGITHAKHKKYAAYSFMTVGSIVRAIMAEKSIPVSGHLCNPVEANLSVVPEGAPAVLGPPGISASIDAGSYLAKLSAAEINDKLSSFQSSLDMQQGGAVSRATIRLDPQKPGHLLIEKPIRPFNNSSVAELAVSSMTSAISKQIGNTLWDDYVEAGSKAGKWKEADQQAVKPHAICSYRNRKLIGCEYRLLTDEEAAKFPPIPDDYQQPPDDLERRK